MKTRYPAECPVFEATADYMNIRAGEIVEGVEVCELGDAKWIGVRLVADESYSNGFRDGYEPFIMLSDELRPLTRAARQMLAIVERK